MSEIIDVLAPEYAGCATFTVNNAVDYVDQTAAGTPAKSIFQNASASKAIQKGDNFSILSAGLLLPEAFTLYKNSGIKSLPTFGIRMQGVTSGATYNIDAFGFVNLVSVPMENHETAFDLFVDCSKQYRNAVLPLHYLDENFLIYTDSASFKISMLGVPAALNGKVFPIIPFIKVSHNLVMI